MVAVASIPFLRLPRRHHISISSVSLPRLQSRFFGPPGTPDTALGLVSAVAWVLHALFKAHCRWWLTAPLVRKVVTARKAVKQAWEVVGLERSLEVVPLAQPRGVKGPTKLDYRRLLRKPHTARIEPTYVSGRVVPLEVQAAVGLDQFRTHHLRPILRDTLEELCAVVPWRVTVMPSLVLTIDSVRTALRKARKSTPYRDLIEYCMIEWLRDTELQWVVEFLRSVSARVPLWALVHGDFYALPAKVPHGPIVNARPLLNFITRLILVGAHIAHRYVPLLARAGVLPCIRFALHASSSVADLLHVLHDYIWFRFFRRQRVCLVVDDV